MPRVSETHLERRRQQILEAALRCFAREGFHATSMQDVVAESGLSAGAVYRYFPSKSALVVAAATGVLTRNSGVLTELLDQPQTPSPTEVVREVLARMLSVATSGEYDLTRVAVSAWGEALRDPELAEAAQQIYREVRGNFRRLAEHWRDEGSLQPGLDPEVVSQLLLSGLIGFAVQRLVLGDVDPDRYASGLAALTTGPGTS